MKRFVYLRTYFGHVVTIIAALIAATLLCCWTLREYDPCKSFFDIENLANIAEPLLIAIGAMVVIVSGTKFAGNLREIRSQRPSEELEKIEDKSLEPWRSINHSFSRIEWTPDIEPRLLKALQEFCRDHKLVRIFPSARFRLATCILEQLREETGTINFRLLKLLGIPKFIRIYKNPNHLDLECRNLVRLFLNKKGVFSKRTCNPLKSEKLRVRAGDVSTDLRIENAVCRPAGEFDDSHVAIQVFPYVDFDGHFRGQTIGELGAVGRQLGKLQAELAKMTDEEGRQTIIEYQRQRDPGGPEMPAAEIREHWTKLRGLLPNKDGDDPKSCLPQITWKEVQALDGTFESVARLRDQQQSEADLLLLHDVHPHNVVMNFHPKRIEDSCTLIYDYTWAGLWNHATMTAFALHRFVREFVRVQGAWRISEAERAVLIRRGTSAFLKGYRHWNALNLPDDFLPQIGVHIDSGNFEKLLNILRRTLGLLPDPLMRSQQRMAGEVRKFVRFTKEATAFSAALRGAPSVALFVQLGDEELKLWDPQRIAAIAARSNWGYS